MQVKIIKYHPGYALGFHDVTDERAAYLIRVGVAEAIEGIYEKEEKQPTKEKVEVKHEREKVETKPGKVPKKKTRK